MLRNPVLIYYSTAVIAGTRKSRDRESADKGNLGFCANSRNKAKTEIGRLYNLISLNALSLSVKQMHFLRKL